MTDCRECRAPDSEWPMPDYETSREVWLMRQSEDGSDPDTRGLCPRCTYEFVFVRTSQLDPTLSSLTSGGMIFNQKETNE